MVCFFFFFMFFFSSCWDVERLQFWWFLKRFVFWRLSGSCRSLFGYCCYLKESCELDLTKRTDSIELYERTRRSIPPYWSIVTNDNLKTRPHTDIYIYQAQSKNTGDMFLLAGERNNVSQPSTRTDLEVLHKEWLHSISLSHFSVSLSHKLSCFFFFNLSTKTTNFKMKIMTLLTQPTWFDSPMESNSLFQWEPSSQHTINLHYYHLARWPIICPTSCLETTHVSQNQTKPTSKISTFKLRKFLHYTTCKA